MIEKMNLCRTPKDWSEITKFIEGSNDPASALIAAMMTWNLACQCQEETSDE
jgi:hypothetical protein